LQAIQNHLPARDVRPLTTSLFVLLAFVLGAPRAAAQSDSVRPPRPEGWSKPVGDTSALFYRGIPYGSEAYNGPLPIMLNKGYDIFQLRQHPRNILSFSYKSTWHYGIRGAFKYPGEAIERFGGWGRFTRVELLPLSFEFRELNWLANYTEHLVGGGLTMRMLDEWYRAHGVPLPRIMAMLNTYAASILNEISEQPNILGHGASGVSDLLFFDIAALLLFQWDQPARFFARTLQTADWSNQASLTLPNKQLQNNGQYFTMKIPIGLERTRFFLRGGMGAQLGFSRRLNEEHHFSFGVGGDTEVREVDEVTGHETVSFAPSAGIYYDRNNSLLWSVTMSPAENVLAVNLYPGSSSYIPNGMGLWAVFTRRNEIRFGLVHSGFGFGYGDSHRR
jgi:hypothetical protein